MGSKLKLKKKKKKKLDHHFRIQTDPIKREIMNGQRFTGLTRRSMRIQQPKLDHEMHFVP